MEWTQSSVSTVHIYKPKYTSYITGEQPKTGNSPSGYKPLQLRGLGMEKEIVSLYAAWTATILIEAENLCSLPSPLSFGRMLKNASGTTPPIPSSSAPPSKISNRSTLLPFSHFSKPYKKWGSRINPDKKLKPSETRWTKCIVGSAGQYPLLFTCIPWLSLTS